MLWLPAAERYRRGLLATLTVSAVTYQAIWPVAFVESVASTAVTPLSHVLAGAAGFVAGLPVEASSAPAPDPPDLAAVERRLGQPPGLPGVVWLEVPVLSELPHRLVLGAGRASGLAEDLPVVFGEHWLGRLTAVKDLRAELELWTAPGARTGARLGEGESALNAVFLGRGDSGSPTVEFLGAEADPEEGWPVYWRRREEDPPSLGRLALYLGELEQMGDVERAEDVWVVRDRFPAGARGRVFVGVGALPEEPVREVEVRRAPAVPVLVSDAVWGPRLAAARSDAPFAAAVLLRDEQVVGKVVARRGALCWIDRRAPSEWGRQSLALEAEGGALRESVSPGEVPALGGARDWLFTRAGGPLPRGLFLGRSGEPPPAWWPGLLEVAGR